MEGEFSPLWTAIIVLLSSGTGVALLDFLRELFRKRIRPRNFVDGLKQLGEVYDLMEDIKEAGAHRVMLFTGHNCGGSPKPGSPFYTTALHYVINRKYMKLIGDYRNLAIDHHYVRTLCMVINETAVTLNTDELPECQIRDYYTMENVTQSVWYHLGIVDGALFYLSIATTKEGGFTPHEKTMMTLKANRVAALLTGRAK